MAEDEKELADKLLIVGRVLATILVGVLGMYGFAMIGSLSYPGVGVVVGGLMGLTLCSCFGCCITGLWRYAIPDRVVAHAVDAVPAPIAFALGDHGAFTLIVTVHEITGKTGIMSRLGNQLGAGSFTFVQVNCGTNPVKQTCAKPDLKYNEQFKVKVKALDAGVFFTIKDQDIFGTTEVGQVNINIKRDIIDKKFPRDPVHYAITNRAGSLKDHADVKLKLSFHCTNDYAGDLESYSGDLESVKTPLLKDNRTPAYDGDPLLTTITTHQFQKV